MYLVSHWHNIIQFQSIDLPGEAKQAGSTPHNAAPLFCAIVPVSELLSELLIEEESSTSYIQGTIVLGTRFGVPRPRRESPGAEQEDTGAEHETPDLQQESPEVQQESQEAQQESPGAQQERPAAQQESPGAQQERPGG